MISVRKDTTIFFDNYLKKLMVIDEKIFGN